jgi:hypothetical protein
VSQLGEEVQDSRSLNGLLNQKDGRGHGSAEDNSRFGSSEGNQKVELKDKFLEGR